MTETKPPPEIEKQFEWLNSAIQAGWQRGSDPRGGSSARHYQWQAFSVAQLSRRPAHQRRGQVGPLQKLVFNGPSCRKGKPDWSQLAGQSGNGSQRVDPIDIQVAPPVVTRPASPPVDDADLVEQPATKPPAARPDLTHVKSDGDNERELADALARVLGGRVKGAVDADAVEAIADKCARSVVSEALLNTNKEFESKLQKHLSNGSFPTERVREIVAEMSRNFALRVEFVTAAGEVKPIDGLMHPQVPQITAWLRSNVPVWAWGAAGSGKTHLARQVAAMLEIEPRVVSVDPTLTVAKLLGYRNVANGGFVEGFLYQAYKSGGLVALDEIDTGDPGVVASINALLSNTHYLFPNGETVERHPKFYTLALANSRGTGAVAGYTARNRLDAATLDRFAVIEIKYDAGLELALACGQGAPAQPWRSGRDPPPDTQKRYVEWVQKVRQQVGNSVLISPRASINGCRALRHGIPMAEISEALVFKLVADDTRKQITTPAACHPYEQ